MDWQGHLSSVCVSSCVLVCPELKVGQYVTSQVDEVKNDGRVVRLSVSPLTVAESAHGWNLTNLMPGLLVNATIKKVETTFYYNMNTSSV